MLTLTRKPGERIVIGNDIDITIVEVSRGKVRIGIDAPRGMPVHRGEVRDRIVDANVAATHSVPVEMKTAAEIRPIEIPAGLYGLRGHTRFAMFEVEGNPVLRQLVSLTDELVRLIVIDAELVMSDYPIAAAREAAGFDPDTEVALAAVVTLPSDGRIPTVALASPIVIDVNRGVGAQIILDRPNLPMSVEVAFHDQAAE